MKGVKSKRWSGALRQFGGKVSLPGVSCAFVESDLEVGESMLLKGTYSKTFI